MLSILHRGILKAKKSIRKCQLLCEYRKSNVDFLLLQIPEHGNLGDQAIVLAEEQWLDRLKLKYFEAPAELTDELETKYAHYAPMNQTILVPGGGFLGALWPNEEYRFRRILKAFKNQKIIVWPQTVTFDMDTEDGRRFFEESKEAYTSHPNLTLFVRETKSLKFMKKHMPSVDVRLVPDSVTTLDIPNFDFNRSGILLCLRMDKEKNISSESIARIKSELAKTYPSENMTFTDTVVPREIRKDDRNREVNVKFSEFAHSKLVVTDRLHGMVFAALTGTPCIALSNSNGKVKGVYKWIRDTNPYVKYVDDLNDLASVLQELNLNQEYHYNKSECVRKFQPVVDLLIKKNEQ